MQKGEKGNQGVKEVTDVREKINSIRPEYGKYEGFTWKNSM